MTSTALHDLGVAQLATELRERRVSAVEAAQHFLARAQAHQNLGAYVALNPDITLAQARAQDAAIAAGTAGPLAGVPIAHKDIFVTKDFPSTAGSLDDPYFTEEDGTDETRVRVAAAKSLKNAVNYTPVLFSEQMKTELRNEVAKALQGKESPKEALDNAVKACDRLLQQQG